MKWCYRSQYVRCGKRFCRSCPHGPYWYRFAKVGGKTRSEYVGKENPFTAQYEGKEPGDNRLDDIFNRKTATVALALEIFGLALGVDQRAAKIQFRKLSLKLHPDRGGDHKAFARLNAAWSLLKVWYEWKD